MNNTPITDELAREFSGKRLSSREAGSVWSLCRDLERELNKVITALAQSKEANAGLMRACDNLERELADKRSQINRLINVIKSRNNDKVYCDKKYNELRDEVMATREQRDTLAEALEELERTAGQSTLWADPARHNARKALAAMKGGSDE
jgi:chromosome segregation ATPase